MEDRDRKRRRKGEGAIYSYCDKCFTNNPLDAKACAKCNLPFGRSRKYRVVVWHQGQRTTKVVQNLTLAREIADAVKTDNTRGEFNIKEKKPKPPPTLDDVWLKYLVWAKQHKATWDDDDGNYRKHLQPRFGKKRLDVISALAVNALKLDMTRGKTKNGEPYLSKQKKLFSASTIKHQLVLLQRLYKFAQGPDFKYKGETPFDHKQVVMPHLEDEPPRFLSTEQLSDLWKTLDSWPDKTTAGFIKIALLLGVRRGTLFSVRWDDVDCDRGMVALKISHRRKGSETALKKLCPEAVEVLKELPRTGEFIFPGKGGGERVDFKGPWRRVRKAAGLPDTTRFHDLRHTFGSYHAMNGTPPQVLQELMGHRDFRTTLRYAKLAPSVVNDVAARAGELLAPKREEGKVVNLKKE